MKIAKNRAKTAHPLFDLYAVLEAQRERALRELQAAVAAPAAAPGTAAAALEAPVEVASATVSAAASGSPGGTRECVKTRGTRR